MRYVLLYSCACVLLSMSASCLSAVSKSKSTQALPKVSLQFKRISIGSLSKTNTIHLLDNSRVEDFISLQDKAILCNDVYMGRKSTNYCRWLQCQSMALVLLSINYRVF